MLLISLAVLDSIEAYAVSISTDDRPATFHSRIPLSWILRAAFKLRSTSVVPQEGKFHWRTDKGILSILSPQQWQVLELAYHGASFTRCLPCSFSLFSSLTV